MKGGRIYRPKFGVASQQSEKLLHLKLEWDNFALRNTSQEMLTAHYPKRYTFAKVFI